MALSSIFLTFKVILIQIPECTKMQPTSIRHALVNNLITIINNSQIETFPSKQKIQCFIYWFIRLVYINIDIAKFAFNSITFVPVTVIVPIATTV